MPYAHWKPIISAEDVYKKFTYFLYPQAFDTGLFWIEGRPSEGGRFVLVMKNPKGEISDITPREFSVRTRVLEYGGQAYTVHGTDLYFVNFKDQRIYWQNLKNLQEVIPITPEKNKDGSLGKYMDLSVSPNGRWLIFAYEKEFHNKTNEAKENQNYIALIDLEKTRKQNHNQQSESQQHSPLDEPQIITSGANFYISPRFSSSGNRVAWLQWNHPYMPWYSTELYTSLFSNGKLISTHQVVGGDESSVGSLTFANDDSLYFTMDKPHQKEDSPSNFYNIYCYKYKGKESNGALSSITQSLAEYHNLIIHGDVITTVQIKNGNSSLKKIHIKEKRIEEFASTYEEFSSLTGSKDNHIFAIARSSQDSPKLLDLTTNKVVKSAYEVSINKEEIPPPQKVEFPTQDGRRAFGYLYLPKNSHYTAPQNEKPPVRVILHGGPTGGTSTSFSMSRIFWTSQGFAIFDVEYRGTTGYGRSYRDALKKKWGLLDVSDVKDGLQYLHEQKLIGDKAFVSGGSAGGYSVQRLLTYYPKLFQGGASYFGIGNLVTLQKLTHKFESQYLSQLIGGTLNDNLKEYQERSPINHLDKLESPMIIFQGSEDKVVPPENSREMANILKQRGVYHEYVEYKGEGHGFIKKENLIDSLNKEAAFFKNILDKN